MSYEGKRLPLFVAIFLIGLVTIFVITQYWIGSDPGISEGQRFRLVGVASGLRFPWSFAFLPGGDMLVTEKYSGHIRIIHDGRLLEQPITNLPMISAAAQGGLLEIALHPKFPENQFVYISYAKPGPNGSTTALGRARFDGNMLSDYHDIFVSNAWSRDTGQYGAKIAFGNDGMLYLAVGDHRDLPRVQDMHFDNGKILRLRDDGTIPDDNPFVGSSDIRPEIFASGMRNQYGLVVDSGTGNIFEHEMGPLGGDELNLILPGRNYGWPVISYGLEYSGNPINGGLKKKEGMEQPLAYWVPSISPAGMALYTGDRFPNWKGNLFIGAHGEKHLRRIVLDGTRVVKQEVLLKDLRKLIRDVRQGPDGLIYFITDGDSGEVMRLEPTLQ